MGKTGRRHYRVAQKEIETDTCSSVCCKKKKKIVAVGVVLLVGAFIKGCVFGYLLGRNNDR